MMEIKLSFIGKKNSFCKFHLVELKDGRNVYNILGLSYKYGYMI